MSALYEKGFAVRVPSWHGLEDLLADFPGREEAMRYAGHDFEIIEAPCFARVGDEQDPRYIEIPGYKQLIKKQLREPEARDETHGMNMGVVKKTYEPVQNSVPWDVIDAIVETPNVNYETGATLDGGRQCFVTAWLDEPRQVDGDDSAIYPYIACNWAHDGTGAFKLIRTSVREVCANTVAAAEAEAGRTGLEFTFRHTKNVMQRIEDAKMAMKGIGAETDAFVELANEIGKIHLTEEQRSYFVSQFIPSPAETLISARVQKNIDEARAKVLNLLVSSPTIPDAHRLTGYGCHQAAGEYLDHLRGYRNQSTYVGRTLLRPEPLKAKVLPLIYEAATV